MSSGCGEVLSLADLQTAKKHQIFEAEVITGRAGGVAGGESIDFATNQNTGQVQKTMPAILRDIGFTAASFDFDTGGTIGVNERNVAVLWPAPAGDGGWYYWEGALPKVIPASSTPATTGGVSDGAWKPVGDIALRDHLASATGSQLVGIRQSNVYAELEITPEMFGADPTGSVSSDLAFQSALDYVATLKNKTLTLKGTYKITGSAALTMADGVTIKGNRRGMSQGPQAVVSSLMTLTNEATIHVDTPSGTTTPLFQAGRNCSFNGFSVVYINQPRSITLLSDLLVYGPTIKASHSCSVTNMRYVAAWDFFNATGEAHFLQNISGYAFNVDYHVELCADVTRFENIHINPNVYRPEWNVIDAVAPRPESRAFELVQHDGVFFNNIHAFGKGTAIHNRQNGTTRLCSLNGSNFLFDKCGTLLDSDVNTSVCAHLSGGTFIHDYTTGNAGNALSLTNPLATQVTSYYLKDWKWQLGSPGKSPGHGSWGPNWMYFGSRSGTRVWLDDINIPASKGVAINNPPSNNRVEGGVLIGTRNIVFRPRQDNLIKNSRLVNINSITNIPRGFTATGNSTVISGRRITGSAVSPPNGSGLTQRINSAFSGTTTAYVYASAKGDSSGILVTAYNNDFSSAIDFSAEWENMGNYYLARVQIPTSVGRTHWDVTVNAPSATGGTVTVQSVHFTEGVVLEFSPESDEAPLTISEVGAVSGNMELVAGVSQQVPSTTYSQDRGIVSLYVKSKIVTGYWVLNKRLAGDVGTVTKIAYAASAGETITITWPSGSAKRPRVTSTLGGTVSITVAGV